MWHKYTSCFYIACDLLTLLCGWQLWYRLCDTHGTFTPAKSIQNSKCANNARVNCAQSSTNCNFSAFVLFKLVKQLQGNEMLLRKHDRPHYRNKRVPCLPLRLHTNSWHPMAELNA
jgi:hypothetical protein